jgi:hypothetical protein
MFAPFVDHACAPFPDIRVAVDETMPVGGSVGDLVPVVRYQGVQFRAEVLHVLNVPFFQPCPQLFEQVIQATLFFL